MRGSSPLIKIFSMPRWRIALVVSSLLGSAIVAGGCSKQSGPPRYTISGTVTFQGSPVPLGRISFDPDTSQGNDGPAGYADIVDGRYRTHMGAVGGPHVVRINGSSGPAVDEMKSTALFREFTTKIDLPRKSTTVDIDVPATAAPRKK